MTEPRRLPLERWGRDLLAASQARADRPRPGRWAFESLMFGLKQGWACLFGGIMVALLFLSAQLWPHDFPVARYDFLVIAALAVQVAMLALRLESLAEARVILLFHIVGLVLVVFLFWVGLWVFLVLCL